MPAADASNAATERWRILPVGDSLTEGYGGKNTEFIGKTVPAHFQQIRADRSNRNLRSTPDCPPYSALEAVTVNPNVKPPDLTGIWE